MENEYKQGENQQIEGKQKWTVIIYMAGDNNLSQDMITAINGIENATQNAINNETHTGEVTIVAEFDGQHPVAETRRYVFNKNLDITSITTATDITGAVIKEKKAGETVFALTNEATSTSEALKSLIKFSVENFPAENYAIIFSCHSDAFLGRTLLLDENPRNAMTLQILDNVLSEAAKEYLPKEKQKFDVIAFDSCVMNIFEVVYELRQLTDFWIGSQGSIPNFTWDYLGITDEIVRATNLEPVQLSQIVVDKVQAFNLKYAFGGRSIDISYWKLEEDKLQAILENISELAKILIDKMIDDFEIISHSIDNTYSTVQRLLLKAHNMCQTYMYEQAVDIKDFSQCLKIECVKVIRETFMLLDVEVGADIESPSLSAAEIEFIKESLGGDERFSEKAKSKITTCYEIYIACQNLVEKIDLLKICGAFSGPDYRFSSGVSLFFPWTQLSYQMVIKEYKDLKFTESPLGGNWEEFLFLYTLFTARDLNLPELFQRLNIDISVDSPLKLNPNRTLSLNIQKEAFVQSVRNKLRVEDSRDNPKLTRGFLEFLYYFGRVRNVYPDLDAEGKFQKCDIDIAPTPQEKEAVVAQ